VFLDISGNSRWWGYGLYAGPGGYGFIDAGNDITISSKVRLEGDSGETRGKYVDDLPFGACWYFYAGGAMHFDGRLTSRGKGIHGYGCAVNVEAEGGVNIGRRAILTTHAMTSGAINIQAVDRAPITLDGRLDARGRSVVYYGSPYGYGNGIYLNGGDVTVNGRALNGGGGSANGIFIDARRLRLGRKARLDAAQGRQYNSPAPTEITIGESMIAEHGSRVLGRSDGSHTITYRDAAKPPVLDGKIKPVADLVVNPLLAGCPVCGNLEIDAGETCDDGNSLAGDGCSDLCQLE
jgi:cysteine-rich repeat protein